MKFKKIILTIFASSLGLCVPAAISIAKTEAVSSKKDSSTSKDDVKKFDDFLIKNGIYLNDLSFAKYPKIEAEINVNFDRKGDDGEEEGSKLTRICATQILLAYAVFENLFKQYSETGGISSIQSSYAGSSNFKFPFKGVKNNLTKYQEDEESRKSLIKKVKEKKIDFDNLKEKILKNTDKIISKLNKYLELLSRMIKDGGKNFDKKQKELAYYLLKQQIYFDRGFIDPEKFLVKGEKYDNFYKDQGKELIKFLKKNIETAISHSKDLVKEIKKVDKKDFEKLKKEISGIYINVFGDSDIESVLDKTLGKTLSKKNKHENSYNNGAIPSPLFCRNRHNEDMYQACKNIFYSMAIDFFNKKIENSADKDKINKIARAELKEKVPKNKKSVRYRKYYSGRGEFGKIDFLRKPLSSNFLENGYKLPLIDIDGMPYFEVFKAYIVHFSKLIGNENERKQFLKTISEKKFKKHLKEYRKLANKRNEERLKNLKDSMDENEIRKYYIDRRKFLIEDLKKENEEIAKTLKEDKKLTSEREGNLKKEIEKNKEKIKKYEEEIKDEKEIKKFIEDNKDNAKRSGKMWENEYKRTINTLKNLKYSNFKKNILDLFN